MAELKPNALLDLGYSLANNKTDLRPPSILRGSGTTLTNNEIKDIMKVARSLENRGILLKGTIRKISSQEGGFLNFLKPLMSAGLPLMKNILTPLAKSVIVPSRLTVAASATDTAIQKNIFRSGRTTLVFLNKDLNDIMKIFKEE